MEGGHGEKLSQCMPFYSLVLTALFVGSAFFVEGATGTMPGQVCATLTYDTLSVFPDGGFSTPATVTFTPVGTDGASKCVTIKQDLQTK